MLRIEGLCTDFKTTDHECTSGLRGNTAVCFITAYQHRGSLKDILIDDVKASELLGPIALKLSPSLTMNDLDSSSFEYRFFICTCIDVIIHAAEGLNHLHSHSIIHRDVASRNLLVGENGTVLVSDFGLSRKVNESKSEEYESYYRLLQPTNALLPVRWMSPESLDSFVFSRASDVWSLGVFAFELFTRAKIVPYVEIPTVNQLMIRVASGRLKLLMPPYCPIELAQVVYKCFEFEPADRPTMSQLIAQLRVVRQQYGIESSEPLPSPSSAPVALPSTYSARSKIVSPISASSSSSSASNPSSSRSSRAPSPARSTGSVDSNDSISSASSTSTNSSTSSRPRAHRARSVNKPMPLTAGHPMKVVSKSIVRESASRSGSSRNLNEDDEEKSMKKASVQKKSATSTSSKPAWNSSATSSKPKAATLERQPSKSKIATTTEKSKRRSSTVSSKKSIPVSSSNDVSSSSSSSPPPPPLLLLLLLLFLPPSLNSTSPQFPKETQWALNSFIIPNRLQMKRLSEKSWKAKRVRMDIEQIRTPILRKGNCNRYQRTRVLRSEHLAKGKKYSLRQQRNIRHRSCLLLSFLSLSRLDLSPLLRFLPLNGWLSDLIHPTLQLLPIRILLPIQIRPLLPLLPTFQHVRSLQLLLQHPVVH